MPAVLDDHTDSWREARLTQTLAQAYENALPPRLFSVVVDHAQRVAQLEREGDGYTFGKRTTYWLPLRDSRGSRLTPLSPIEAAIHQLFELGFGREPQRTRDDVAAYTEARREAYEEFRKRDFWNFENGVEASLKQLTETDAAIDEEMKVLEKKRHLCSMFEFPELCDEATNIMTQIKSEIAEMRKKAVQAKDDAASARKAWSYLQAERMSPRRAALIPAPPT